MDFIPHVKRVDCGLVVKYKLFEHKPDAPCITPLTGSDGSRWYLDKTGTLYPMRVSESKGDNLDSVKRSFSRLRDIINCNALNPAGALFVTFTYDPSCLRSPLTLRKVSNDMANAFRRLRHDGYSFEYVYTVEQQGNGNWHSHCLFFFPGVAPYLAQDYLEWVWQAGFVRVSKRFDSGDIRNVGSYVCADLTYGSGSEHGHVKDERLLSYPSGMHLYRCSRGVARPVSTDIDFSEYLVDVDSLDTSPFYDVEKTLWFGSDTPRRFWFRYQHFLDTRVL